MRLLSTMIGYPNLVSEWVPMVPMWKTIKQEKMIALSKSTVMKNLSITPPRLLRKLMTPGQGTRLAVVNPGVRKNGSSTNSTGKSF